MAPPISMCWSGDPKCRCSSCLQLYMAILWPSQGVAVAVAVAQVEGELFLAA